MSEMKGDEQREGKVTEIRKGCVRHGSFVQ